MQSEIYRSMCLPLANLMVGNSVGVTPIYHFGSENLKDKVLPEIINGDKTISLCISEPHAGSDVRNIKTTATLINDKYYINGEKKWITNGL